MSSKYSVTVSKVARDNSLEILFMPDLPDNEIIICSQDVNRPGLLFAGYDGYFDKERVEFVGLAEMGYLKTLDSDTISERLNKFFGLHPSCVILTRNLEVPEEFIAKAKEYGVPLLRTAEPTSLIMATIIAYLEVELAERITRHGVLVEVYGEGILILGDSGVGKSETAVELIKRGHRLIADDAVEIKRVSSKTLVGSAPENIRHFMELRGIGIVNARTLFGVGAVKLTEKIDFVIQLEQWNPEKNYGKLGIEDEYTTILGIKVPATVVPVKPGRNLAIIVEIASMNNRQKKLGYNAANELMQQLGMDDADAVSKELEFWD